LEDSFKAFGEIRDIAIKRDFAFIDFKNPEDAEKAVEGLNDSKVQGDTIRVELTKPKSERRRP
jgi:RNA recognition motif-containing protein